MNLPPPSWTPGVCWWLPRQERPLGWTEGLEQNPFKDGLSARGLGWWAWCQGSWGKMRDPRELGFYIMLDGHVLEAVLEIRNGTDSWHLVPWHQLYRTSVSAGPHGPCGVGVLGCVLNVYSLEPSQPGFTFLPRDSCSRWARLQWSPVASRTVSWTGNLAVSAGYRHFLLCPPPTRVSGFGDVSCTIWVLSQRQKKK